MIVAVAVLLGCTPAGGVVRGGAAAEVPSSAAPAAVPSASATDSARGVLRIAGPMPGELTLDRAREESPLALEDESREPGLRHAEGLEIVVFGRDHRTAGRFVVARFAVRAVDGVPAVDGVLERSGALHALRLADGRRVTLAAPPAAFVAAADGTRVFWAGPFDRPPRAYGILGP